MRNTTRNKMYKIIYSHKIVYHWDDGEDIEMDEHDVERVVSLLKKNYFCGQLCHYDANNDAQLYGWWNIEGKGYSPI